MAKTKQNKHVLYLSLLRFCIFVILSAVTLVVCLIYQTPIEKIINGRDIQTDEKNIDYNGLVIHYIDVGQGDSIAIEFPDNKKMLIDAGKEKNSGQLLKYLEKKVFSDGENEFDYVLMTHSDEDHIGGMPVIFEKYQVNKVFRPQLYINESDISCDSNAPSNAKDKNLVATSIYKRTITAVYNEPSCEQYFTVLSLMNTTQKIYGGTGENYYEFEFYSPNLSYYKNVNDYSPIMKLTYMGKTFLFTGDATTVGEKEAVTNGIGKVDVLKVGHHGSTTSSGKDFINAVRPTYAMIEVGKGNTYGHPSNEIINRLEYSGTKIFRTDINKSIIANVNSEGSLLIYPNIADKVSVWYFICGVEAVEIYFCFFVKYKTDNKEKKRKTK